jgi:uncharacterized protein (TIGR02996 family)
MPDAEAFLRAIIASPDDDGPRLVYADWLEENGEPERAEFIRVQIELARNGIEGRAELRERENQLLKRYRRYWYDETATLLPEHGFLFRRGFVNELGTSMFEFVEIAEQLYRQSPVQYLRLYAALAPPHEQARLVRRLSEIPGLACVRSLSLEDNYIGSDGVQALAVCTHLVRLETLDLRGNHIGERGIRALVEAPWFSHLTALDLVNNDVNAAAAHALGVALDALEADGRLRLRQLSLEGNPLRTAGMRVIRASPALRRVARL